MNNTPNFSDTDNVASLCFLVAEDNEFQRGAVCRMLRQITSGEVHAVEDGKSAIKVLADGSLSVDVLLLDLALPGMDFLEILQAIPLVNDKVAVILNSALHEELLETAELLATAHEINVLGIVRKPVTSAKLLPLLKRIE